jgi:major membrane immunogen (membrane-anchored lipoprotein)
MEHMTHQKSKKKSWLLSKQLLRFVSILFLFGTLSAHAQTGLIPGSIWFSKEKLVEGEIVTIYTAVWNASKETLSGTVVFSDKEVILGTREFKVPGESLEDISIEWSVTAGDHIISANVTNATYLTKEGKTTTASLTQSTAKKEKQFVPKTVVQKEEGVVEEKPTLLDTIQSYTPESVTNVVSASTKSSESFREGTGTYLETKKDAIKDQIQEEKIAKESGTVKAEQVKSKTHTPLLYVGLFFTTIGSFIFNNTIIFYGLGALILFFILKKIYRKFFPKK